MIFLVKLGQFCLLDFFLQFQFSESLYVHEIGDTGHEGGGVGDEHGDTGYEDGNNPQPREWSDEAKLTVYAMLLERTTPGKLKRGVTKEVARLTGMPLRTVQEIWNNGKKHGGMLGVLNNKRRIWASAWTAPSCG